MAEGDSSSVLQAHIPLVNAVLVGIWLIGTTITLTVQWVTVGNKIELATERIYNRVSAIENDMRLDKSSRWTIDTHELWCIKTEKLNPGWKCGDLPPRSFGSFRAGSNEYWRQDKPKQ